MRTLTVLKPGPATTVQDAGRSGLAHLGIPRAGAADLPALRLANRLLGNHPDAAGLEATLVGPRLRFEAAARIALTGAPSRARLDGAPIETGTAVDVAAGAVLDVGRALSGVRIYIAVDGGIAAPPVLGSRSRDTLSGLGPSPLAAGDIVALGDAGTLAPEDGGASSGGGPVGGGSIPALRVIPGPRADWFAPGTVERLCAEAYTVEPTSDRVGVRLRGPALTWARDGELASEGLVAGALQVPRSGQPILLLADHPTTGGYPVIAVVHSEDVARAAQLRPGTSVHFRPIR